MKLRAQEIEIVSADPFGNDKLNLIGCAENLTKLIKASEGGFTLSINAKWGHGKTTFVKMWQQQLQNEGYYTIYLNAWETDFAQDPLLALIDSIYDKIKENCDNDEYKILSPIFDSLIDIIKCIPGVSWAGHVAETIKSISDNGRKDENLFDEYRTYNSIFKEFREKLKEFASTVPQGKLIIFMDELDRCRPNYAVEMLERVKHLFSVPNLYFVISIDKNVLLEAIRGVYNSQNINAESYLRRFIDLEYTLPEPDVSVYIQHLYKQYGLSAYESKYWEMNDKTYFGHVKNFEYKKTIVRLFDLSTYSLRDIEKYFTRLSVIMKTMAENKYSIYITSLTLFLYIFENQIYYKLKSKEYNYEELLLSLENAIYRKTSSTTEDLYYKYIIYHTAAHYARFRGDSFEKEVSMRFCFEKFKFSQIPANDNDKNIYDSAQKISGCSDFDGLFPILELVNVTYEIDE